jgi:phenylacetate-CoA ligase
MLIIRGVNVFPQQIEAIIIEAEGTSPHYQIVVTRDGNLDNIEVQIEVSGDFFSDAIKNLQRREARIQKTIKEFLGVTAKVRLVEPRTIQRSEGKAKRVVDLREVKP